MKHLSSASPLRAAHDVISFLPAAQVLDMAHCRELKREEKEGALKEEKDDKGRMHQNHFRCCLSLSFVPPRHPTSSFKKKPPLQAEDLAELSALSREAAEIMWEFAALGEKTPAAAEVADKARALRAQLRGLISDFSGGDEVALAAALEAFEMLETTLGEYDGGGSEAAAAAPAAAEAPTAAAAAPAAEANPFAAAPAAAPAAAAPRPTTAPGNRPDPGSDAPLISFD